MNKLVSIPLIMGLLVLSVVRSAYADSDHSAHQTPYFVLGYDSAVHNATMTNTCYKFSLPLFNQSLVDCINGYLAGLPILYPPAKYYHQGYRAGLKNETFEMGCPKSISISPITYDKCYDGNKAGQLAFDSKFSAFKKGFI